MTRYTPEFLAVARHGYENTDQPMRELARELGIGITTLSTLGENNGWAKRSQRKRGLPPALQVLEEARALAASLPPRSGGEGRLASPDASRGGGTAREDPPTPDPTPPLAALAEGGEQSLLARMEQLLAQHIAAAQAAVAGGEPSPQATRNFTMLSQALRTLAALRTGTLLPKAVDDDDDDMPADIDEFRRELARRIDAFVASRGHEFDSQDDPEAA